MSDGTVWFDPSRQAVVFTAKGGTQRHWHSVTKPPARDGDLWTQIEGMPGPRRRFPWSRRTPLGVLYDPDLYDVEVRRRP